MASARLVSKLNLETKPHCDLTNFNSLVKMVR